MFRILWNLIALALGIYAGLVADPYILEFVENDIAAIALSFLLGIFVTWLTITLSYLMFQPVIRILENPIGPLKRKIDGVAASILLYGYIAIITLFQILLTLPFAVISANYFLRDDLTNPIVRLIQHALPVITIGFFGFTVIAIISLFTDYLKKRIWTRADFLKLVFLYAPVFNFLIAYNIILGSHYNILAPDSFEKFIVTSYLVIAVTAVSTVTEPTTYFLFTAFWLGLSFFRTIYEPGWYFKVSKRTLKLRDHLRRASFGLGGSSAFAGFWKEWEFPYYKGSLFLGKSLYGKLFLGLDDDRHFLTIAGSRGGKGISYIIPNLLLWPQNIICLDPKGSNTEVTALKRAADHHQDVHVIDPYGKTSVKSLHRRYNPLVEVNPHSLDCVKQIDIITSALVISGDDKNRYWDESAEKIIKGFIAHVVTDPAYEGNRSLVAVYKALLQPEDQFKAILQAMALNPGCNGLAREAAAMLSNAQGEHRGSLLTTVATHIKFLEDPRVQDLLGGTSDFSMFDLPSRPVSIYIVLEGTDLMRLNRFMRLFILLAFYTMENPQGGAHNRTRKTLFILDEFYSLGHMPILEKAAAIVAGIGVKLWPIIQNIGQLQDLYGKNWETFIDNAAAIQVFSLAGQGTKDYVMQKLGQTRSMVEDVSHMAYQKKWTQNNNYRTASSYQIRALLDPNELEKEFARSRGFCLIFPTGEDPLVVQRIPYYDLFNPSAYDQDPDYADEGPAPINYGWTPTQYFGSNSAILLEAGNRHAAKPFLGEILDAPGPTPFNPTPLDRPAPLLEPPIPALPPLPPLPELPSSAPAEEAVTYDEPQTAYVPEEEYYEEDATEELPAEQPAPVAIGYEDALSLMGLKNGFNLKQLRTKYATMIDQVHPDMLEDLEQAYYFLKDPANAKAYFEVKRQAEEEVDQEQARIAEQDEQDRIRAQDLKALALAAIYTQQDLQDAYLDNLNDLPEDTLNAAYERLKQG